MNDIQKTESPLMTAAELVSSNGNMDVAKLKELLELQERWEATQAKKAYTVAMSAFKANPPEIIKDKNVKYKEVNYNHASLSNVTTCINKALSEHGLTASWVTGQDGGSVKVTCKITHVLGHSEETSLVAQPDGTGSKNPIQAIGSTVTYLQRYTLLALTGLATCEQDDDGAGSGSKGVQIEPPNKQQQKVIDKICEVMVCPDGFKADPLKVAAICYERKQTYPADIKGAEAIARWLVELNRPELFIPDERDELDKQLGLPGDEDSQPDEPKECRFFCKACDAEFDTLDKHKCPECASDQIIDRVIAKKVKK